MSSAYLVQRAWREKIKKKLVKIRNNFFDFATETNGIVFPLPTSNAFMQLDILFHNGNYLSCSLLTVYNATPRFQVIHSDYIVSFVNIAKNMGFDRCCCFVAWTLTALSVAEVQSQL